MPHLASVPYAPFGVSTGSVYEICPMLGPSNELCLMLDWVTGLCWIPHCCAAFAAACTPASIANCDQCLGLYVEWGMVCATTVRPTPSPKVRQTCTEDVFSTTWCNGGLYLRLEWAALFLQGRTSWPEGPGEHCSLGTAVVCRLLCDWAPGYKQGKAWFK